MDCGCLDSVLYLNNKLLSGWQGRATAGVRLRLAGDKAVEMQKFIKVLNIARIQTKGCVLLYYSFNKMASGKKISGVDALRKNLNLLKEPVFYFNKQDLKHLQLSKKFMLVCMHHARLCSQAAAHLNYSCEVVRNKAALKKALAKNSEGKLILMGTEPITPAQMGWRNWHKKMIESLQEYEHDIIPVNVYEQDKKIPDDYILLNDEVNTREGKKYLVRFGDPLTQKERKEIVEHHISLRKYLKAVFYCQDSILKAKNFFQAPKTTKKIPDVAEPIDGKLIEAEIKNLNSADLLFTSGEFEIYVAHSKQIPNTLQQIGRLREITFREAGEGSNKPFDLDLYDLFYEQLIIWDANAKKIAGGYRLCNGHKLMASHGIKGFYCNSLFEIQKEFETYLGQSLELGRSYIIKEYQRHRMPLFLLWKGIFFYLQKNKELRYLLGPVSISKFYSDVSKQLIVSFIKQNCYDAKLAAMVKPRKEFQYKRSLHEEILLEPMNGQLEKLDDFIKNIEPEHFRLPVLVKKYLKINAKIIAFNIDPSFNDVLDGFIFLDLHSVPAEMIEAVSK